MDVACINAFRCLFLCLALREACSLDKTWTDHELKLKLEINNAHVGAKEAGDAGTNPSLSCWIGSCMKKARLAQGNIVYPTW